MNDRENPNIFSFGVDKNFQNSDKKINEFDSNNGKYSFNNEENTEINPFENNVLTEIKKPIHVVLKIIKMKKSRKNYKW